MKECWRCGEKIADEEAACPYCGTDIPPDTIDRERDRGNWLDRFPYRDICASFFWPSFVLLFLGAFGTVGRSAGHRTEWPLAYAFSAFLFSSVCRAVRTGVIEGKFHTTRRADDPAGFNRLVNFGLLFCGLIFLIASCELFLSLPHLIPAPFRPS